MLSRLTRASLLVAMLATPLAAQTKGSVTVGTDPAAESFRHDLNDVSDQY